MAPTGSSSDILNQLKIEAKIEVIDEMIRFLQAQRASATMPEGPSLAGVSLVEAARQILEEHGPRGTREIAHMMLARGIRTNAKNFIATVYTTLKNAKDDFKRTPEGTWVLKEKERKRR